MQNKMKMNPYFDPDNCPFEVLGFTEDLIDAKTGKLLGQRRLKEPTRPTGSPGMIEYDLTEPTEVTYSISKTKVINASPEKPVRVIGMIQIICGRVRHK